MSKRENFPPEVKRIIAQRAGYICSYPGCNHRTVFPGDSPEQVELVGEAAHIYSAAKNGPRGQGKLSPQEIRSAPNGIWLCSIHSAQIDKNKGADYTPELLIGYKYLHEQRTKTESRGLFSPFGWLDQVEIVDSKVFNHGECLRLSKLTLLKGENGVGKSAICEWICECFGGIKSKRWKVNNNTIKVSYLLNKQTSFTYTTGNNIRGNLRIDGISIPVESLPIKVIKPKLDKKLFTSGDILKSLARTFGVDENSIYSIADEAVRQKNSHISKYNFVGKRKVLELNVRGTVPDLEFRGLSGTEQQRVLLEFAIAYAKLSGKICPTLLILDHFIWPKIDGWFEDFLGHFIEPTSNFQTIMTVPEVKMETKNIKINGWNVVTIRSGPSGSKIVEE